MLLPFLHSLFLITFFYFTTIQSQLIQEQNASQRDCEDQIYKQLTDQNIKYVVVFQYYILVLDGTKPINLEIETCKIRKTIIIQNYQQVKMNVSLHKVENLSPIQATVVNIYNCSKVDIDNITLVDTEGHMLDFDIIQNFSINKLDCQKCSQLSIGNIDNLKISKLSIDRNKLDSTVQFFNITSFQIETFNIKQIYGYIIMLQTDLNIQSLIYSKDPQDQKYHYQQPDKSQKDLQYQIFISSKNLLFIEKFEIYYIAEVFWINSSLEITINKILFKNKEDQFFSRDSTNEITIYCNQTINIQQFEIEGVDKEDNKINLWTNTINIQQLKLNSCKQFQLSFYGICNINELYYNSQGYIQSQIYTIYYNQALKVALNVNHLYFGNDSNTSNSSQPNLILFGWDRLYFQNVINLSEQPFQLETFKIEEFQIDKLVLNFGKDNKSSKTFFTQHDIRIILIKEIVINLNVQFNIKIFSSNLIESIIFEKITINDIFAMNQYPFEFISVEDLQIKQFNLNNACFNKGIIRVQDVGNIGFFNSKIQINNLSDCHITPNISDQNAIKKLKRSLFREDDNQASFFVIEYLKRDTFFYKNYQYLFENIYADFNGFNARIIDSRRATGRLTINQCTFKNMHTIQNGGCVKLQNLNVMDFQSIIETTFDNCKSENFGGAIFGSSIVGLKLVNISNSAAAFGGAYYASSLSFRTQIFNTTSLHLSNIILMLKSIKISKILEYNDEIKQLPSIIDTFDFQNNQTYKLKPGVKYILLLDICLATSQSPSDDLSNKIIKCFSENKSYYNNMYHYINQTITQEEDNEVKESFLSLDIHFLQTQSYLVFQPKSNKQYSQISLQFLTSFNLSLPFEQLNCSVGQFQNYIKDNQFMCQFCPEMSASYFIGEQRNCTQCDPMIFSDCYGNYSLINQNYYREYLTLNREEIYKCNQFNFCVGGQGFGNSLCSEGRIGVECTSCDIHGAFWNQSYSQSRFYSCVRCGDISNNLIKIIFLLVGVIVFLFLVIYSNTASTTNVIIQQYLSKMKIIYLGSSFQKMGQSSVYIKIFCFYASMMYFIQQQLNIDLKSLMIDYQMQFSDPLKTSMVSLDCALKEQYPHYQDISYLKLSIYLSLPIIILPNILIPNLIRLLFKMINKKQFFYIISLSCIYILFISFYNPILSICLDSLLCRQFGNKNYYSLLDLTLSCDEGKRYRFLALTGIIVYSIIVPLIIVLGLTKNKKNLNKISTLFTYGFLYRDYKLKYFYWELVRFSVKIMQVIIQKIYTQSTFFMNCVNILFLLFYLVPLIILRPFAISYMNQIEIISVCIIIFNFFGLMIFSNERNNDNHLQDQSQAILLISLVLSFVFFIYLIICIIHSIFETRLLKLQRYSQFVRMCIRFQFFQKIVNQQRIRSNMIKFRVLVKKIIGQEIPNFNSQKVQSLCYSYSLIETEQSTLIN